MYILQKKIFKNKSNYYCLVAGLPEFSFDGDRDINVVELRHEIKEVVTPDDAKAIDLIYLFFDILNLVNVVDGGRLPFNKLGTLSLEQIEMEIDAVSGSEDEEFVSLLPGEMSAIVDRYKGRVQEEDDDNEVEAIVNVDDLQMELLNYYYKIAAQSDCTFVRIYSALDRQIRNIVAASRARVMGVDPVTMLVGDGELEQQICSSNAVDFGLRGEFEYFEQLWSVIETEDFVDREKKMDALRWSIADTICESDYFGIDMLSGYLVKLNILYRWRALDREIGAARFGEIVESFTREMSL